MAPKDELPSADDGYEHFPDIPTNDHGKKMLRTGSFPDIPTNDHGKKSFSEQPPPDRFPEINTNDKGADSE